ncbi:MAG: magnesium transporter, partial [Clostridia bacterium]|nr:magnesium transporter [Clostridia bacterium]
MFEKFMELFEQRNYLKMKEQLNEMHAPDVAILLEEVAEESQKKFLILFRLLNKELAAETFVEMSSDNQEYLINTFSDAELKSVFEELFVDDTVDIIEE